jgi:hypothetical protein
LLLLLLLLSAGSPSPLMPVSPSVNELVPSVAAPPHATREVVSKTVVIAVWRMG